MPELPCESPVRFSPARGPPVGHERPARAPFRSAARISLCPRAMASFIPASRPSSLACKRRPIIIPASPDSTSCLGDCSLFSFRRFNNSIDAALRREHFRCREAYAAETATPSHPANKEFGKVLEEASAPSYAAIAHRPISSSFVTAYNSARNQPIPLPPEYSVEPMLPNLLTLG